LGENKGHKKVWKMLEKILLIQPPDPEGKVVFRDHAGKFGILETKTSVTRYDVFPPLDLAYSAALLEKNNYDVNIIDSPTLGLKRSEILREIVSKNPELIIVNTSGVTIESDLDLASWLKKTLEIETVVISPAYVPENILMKSDIDIFIYGEVEHTILELCQKYPNIKEIEGIFYKKDNKLFYNPKRPFILNLDELPFPAYHLLPMKKYSHHIFRKKGFMTVLSSRGCPFGCTYCVYPIGYGNVWRGRSPENVLEELKILKEKYKVKSVLFRDAVFNFNPQRVEKICDGLIEKGIDIDWRCECRADLLSKNLLLKMKKAGCFGVNVGVESGDPEILKNIAKRGLSIEKVKEVFQEAREIDLEITAFFMIGFPNETKESISKTFELVKEIRPKSAWFCAVTPYPGTELYELAKNKGWILTENLENYSGRKVVMRNDNLTEDDIKKAVETANVVFSNSNTQLLKTIFSRQGISSALLNPRKAVKFTLGRLFKGNKMRVDMQ
jgi:radical SAM superfamily enzyme YgiQ (UPF0313 family)